MARLFRIPVAVRVLCRHRVAPMVIAVVLAAPLGASTAATVEAARSQPESQLASMPAGSTITKARIPLTQPECAALQQLAPGAECALIMTVAISPAPGGATALAVAPAVQAAACTPQWYPNNTMALGLQAAGGNWIWWVKTTANFDADRGCGNIRWNWVTPDFFAQIGVSIDITWSGAYPGLGQSYYYTTTNEGANFIVSFLGGSQSKGFRAGFDPYGWQLYNFFSW